MPSPKAITGDVPFFLSPYPYLFAFIFLLLNSVHLYSTLLMQVRLELFLTVAILTTAGMGLVVFSSVKPSRTDLLFLFLCLLLVGAPLLTSLSNGTQLSVIYFREYKSWVKMLAVAPVLYLCFATDTRLKESLISTMLASVTLLALVFWYRFAVLGEVRDFDLRPVLNMKNGDPNFLCVLFGTLIPLIVYRINRALKSFQLGKLSFYAALLALYLSVILACESRMGLLSVAAGLLYLLIKAPPPLRKVGGVGFVLFLGISLYGGVGERFSQLNDRSNLMRLRTLETGAKMFTESPVLGHGWDSAPGYFFALSGYPRLLSETAPLQIHNTLIQLLAELGLYGFLAYVGFIGFALWQVVRGRNALAVYALSGMIVLCLNLLTLPLQSKDFVVLLAACLAAIGTERLPDRLLPNRDA